MSVLTLRLAGPLQSWGATGRFVRRTTESAPTKSGVVGLLAAAKGIQRDDTVGLAPLAALRYGVRIDQPGTRIRDFHTAHHPVSGKAMPLSERFYLADAVFVAAVETSDTQLLTTLQSALRQPVYPAFLGRRSCPPAGPVDLHLHPEATLEEALHAEPWQAAPWYRRRHQHSSGRHGRPHSVTLTVLREPRTDEAGADTVPDQPVSFSPAHRRHHLRPVVSDSVQIPLAGPLPPHDPFDALGLEEESA
ncbi:type I-E CRISPR-associated protein Cas5/CasD [Streptomyces longispororuber]|uniref:type I-E CRISPR-associated protein Cas5/CasD n=1 Tax=Streptomyces longispororuber TaxID=68230 RepID=UPI00210B27C4|nr:type I-E CRISPR-associated protein Cas5/CasD [Streptomyces longispororuber]MCQ4210394.1 type I-E CRISPR-associated protein Cas5/CasD [Streptomyces longispororuber]